MAADPTAEVVVVALTGGRESRTVLDRAAEIASRSGASLVAVHVASESALAPARPALLARQRALTEEAGGTFHQVSGTDIAEALLGFARSVHATQLVVGVSRRARLRGLLGGLGTGARVARQAGGIDVHVVAHEEAGRRPLPRLGGALSVRRRIAGFALAVAGLPLLTVALVAIRSPDTLATEVLLFQLLVVVVALVGGLWPALTAAVLAGASLNYFFIDPRFAVTVENPLQVVSILVFVLVGALVSLVVDRSARQYRIARRSSAESETLAALAGGVLGGGDALASLVRQVRETFGLAGVILRDRGEVVHAATAGAIATDRDRESEIRVGDRAALEIRGHPLAASDQRVLGAFVSQIEAALAQRDLAEEAERTRRLEQVDRVRTALLAAVGHDLRRPLAAATAAITGLRDPAVSWSDGDRADLLETADESLAALSELVTDLLDASRIQAGALVVALEPTAIDEVVALALEELDAGPGRVELELSALPPVAADPVLLQRVVVNLVSNALRHAPGLTPVVRAERDGGSVRLSVVDTGPGIPADRREQAFAPFQRFGDTDNTAGIGLGLALSRGFVEGMAGTLVAGDTPGGGLTMTVTLPVAAGRSGGA